MSQQTAIDKILEEMIKYRDTCCEEYNASKDFKKGSCRFYKVLELRQQSAPSG